jgi:hypothetical protein
MYMCSERSAHAITQITRISVHSADTISMCMFHVSADALVTVVSVQLSGLWLSNSHTCVSCNGACTCEFENTHWLTAVAVQSSTASTALALRSKGNTALMTDIICDFAQHALAVSVQWSPVRLAHIRLALTLMSV